MTKFCLRISLCLLSFLFTLPLLAQQSLPQLTRFDESDANITLDGFVDEAVWENIPVVDGMRVINPDTLAETPYETHVRMFYTERGIYISSINYQPAETLVARMTSRDTQLDRDGFVVGIWRFDDRCVSASRAANEHAMGWILEWAHPGIR